MFRFRSISTTSWIACGWVLRIIRLPNLASHRVTMGAFVFIVLMVAEVLNPTQLVSHDLTSHFTLYWTPQSLIALLGQIEFASFRFIERQVKNPGANTTGKIS